MTTRISAKTLIASSVAGLLLAGAVGTPAMAAPTDEVFFADSNLQNCINARLGQPAGTAITEARAATVMLLTCNGREINSLVGAESLTTLQHLFVQSNNITDATPLAGLNRLVNVQLSHNPLGEVSGLGNHPELQNLELSSTEIDELSELTDLPKLRTLRLSDNEVSDLTPLAGIPSLEQLSVEDNNIESLSGLENLPNLVLLAADRNKISDLSPIADSGEMQTLLLNSNNISDASAVAGMPLVSQLDFGDNHIADVSAFAVLDALTSVNLDNQTINLADIAVGLGQSNPLVSSDFLPIQPASITAMLDAATNSWSFAEPAVNELSWHIDLNLIAATGPSDLSVYSDAIVDETAVSFSGTIVQRSVAGVISAPEGPKSVAPGTDIPQPEVSLVDAPTSDSPVNADAATSKTAATQPLAQTGSQSSTLTLVSAVLLAIGAVLATARRLSRTRTDA